MPSGHPQTGPGSVGAAIAPWRTRVEQSQKP